MYNAELQFELECMKIELNKLNFFFHLTNKFKSFKSLKMYSHKYWMDG